jgi:hypothetical protein
MGSNGPFWADLAGRDQTQKARSRYWRDPVDPGLIAAASLVVGCELRDAGLNCA